MNKRLLPLLVLPLLGAMIYGSRVTAQVSDRLAQSTESNQQSDQQPQHRRPDFAAAAQQLGISEAELREALGIPTTPPAPGERPPRPDFAAAAERLGISEETLINALGLPERPPRPDFAAAAQELGVSEAELQEALGVPTTPPAPGERPPRPDFAAAAERLGVTEEALVNALGVPPCRSEDSSAPRPQS